LLQYHPMSNVPYVYIWQHEDWPNWRYDKNALEALVAAVQCEQKCLFDRLSSEGVLLREQVNLAALSEDVLKTSEIEGERLNPASVRSSIARRLGLDIGALAPVDRHVEGVVEMMLDATANCHAPVTEERLFGWHAALFPTGWSGLSRIKVGGFRDDATGSMQVVSGPVGRQKVHFQAPPSGRLAIEMAQFLEWVNTSSTEQPLIKAAIGHLWFVTVHPFEDGNGRIARAIGDLLLSRADGVSQRCYSVSAQIQQQRQAYYRILEQSQKGSMDVTAWLVWFLKTLEAALQQANSTLDDVLRKSRFWQRFLPNVFNERQIKVLNRLLDGFEGKLTCRKWSNLAKCAVDIARQDIDELLKCGALREQARGGRVMSYEIIID